jgi:hypothetical protein
MLADLFDSLVYSPTAGIAVGFVLTLTLFLGWLAIRPFVRARLGRSGRPAVSRPAPPRLPRG